ncbi:hypothetical protein GGR54DRAFT_583385 [Hypoxylon sp. NC1633]|nr:hypothetical protein GGR54DRAFT_583385 [Hypoxylon sp. NC1633]
MTSNHYPTSYGEGLNFSEQWISQLPPAFLGHTTSFGQQPQQPSVSSLNGMPTAPFQDVFNFGQNMMPPPPPPPLQPSLQLQFSQQQHQHHNTPTPHTPIEQSAHVDVAAVLTSLHHGHQNGHHSSANGISRPVIVPSQHGGAGVDRMRPTARNPMTPEQNSPIRHRHAPSNDAETLFADMMFGSAQGLTGQRQIDTPELQWGSDSSFVRAQGFVPPEHESSELLEQKRLGVLKILSISDSTATTRPSSPLANGEGSNLLHDANVDGPVKEEHEEEAPPAKRRKSRSKAKEEAEEEGEDLSSIPSRAAARKRKSKADLKGTPDASSAAPETAGKRRKSTLISGKQPRENLSDAQKRENHIKSEQKRRGAIKEGFDDLCDLVPNLKGGGYSKSTMLSIAGEWLDTLLKGNEELERL